jgi:hypothetical protein
MHARSRMRLSYWLAKYDLSAGASLPSWGQGRACVFGGGAIASESATLSASTFDGRSHRNFREGGWSLVGKRIVLDNL